MGFCQVQKLDESLLSALQEGFFDPGPPPQGEVPPEHRGAPHVAVRGPSPHRGEGGPKGRMRGRRAEPSIIPVGTLISQPCG